MTATLEMMGRTLPRDVSEVHGKSFEMILSPRGEVQSLAGAEKVTFQMGPGYPESVVPDFQAFFPRLPDGPVQVGDTWASAHTVNDEARSAPAMHLEFVHTLKGFETIDGLECAKVTSVVDGSLEGAEPYDRKQMEYEGSVFGSGTWYFAPEEGLLVRTSTRLQAEGQATPSGRPDMSVPVKREHFIETRLVR
jgi:hypothetical protein